jgi:glutathione S-transferase
MLELYHSGLTTCSKQIRLVLREKGLDYESRYIELWNYENLNKDYLKINEIGVVPTLVHDGVPIRNCFSGAEPAAVDSFDAGQDAALDVER